MSALMALVCCSLSTWAQRYDLWQHITTRNGLIQNSVLDMVTDSLGFLWITTEEGLTRFDGRRFTSFDVSVPSGPGSRSTRMREFVATGDGAIFASDVHGSVYHVNGPAGPELALFERPRATLGPSISTAATYLRIRDMRRPLPALRHWKQGTELPMVGLGPVHWYTLEKDRLLHFTDTALANVTPAPERSLRLARVDDQVLLMTEPGSVYQLVKDDHGAEQFQLLRRASGMERSSVASDLFQSAPKEAILLESNALHRILLDPGTRQLKVTTIDVDLPKGTKITSAQLLERENILLLGTETQGLYIYRPFPMQTLGCSGDELLSMNCFYAQLELPDGRLMVADLLDRTWFIGPDGCSMGRGDLRRAGYTSLIQDHQGRLLFKDSLHLVRYDPAIGRSQRLAGSTYQVSMFPEGDSIWVATRDSIGYLKGDRVHWLQGNLRLVERSRPTLLRRGIDGHLIYGSCEGLFRATDAHCTRFEPVKGLEGTCVRALEVLGDMMLIGTYGNGAFVLRNGQLHSLPNDPSSALSHVHSFLVDGNESIWMSTNRGLVRTTRPDILAYLADKTERPYYAVYRESMGIRNSEFNGGCDPAWIRLQDGRVSYPTMDGIVQFVPEEIPDPFPKARIHIERIAVDGAVHRPGEGLVLSPGTQELELKLSLVNWDEPENSLLEYRITKIQETWQALPLDSRTLRIVRPPAGHYEVIIRKVGAGIRGKAHEVRLQFEVATPFFQTWSGIGSVLVALLLLAWALIKLNNLRLLRQNKKLAEHVASQTRALSRANIDLRNELAHQEKLISIVAHDVVPPLRFISRVANSAESLYQDGQDPDVLRETLRDLNTSAAKLYGNADSLLGWIRSRSRDQGPSFRTTSMHAFISNAFDRIGELARDAGIELVNNVDPEDLFVTDEDLLGVVVNNILLNVRTHARASRITVSAPPTAQGYELVVTDNGHGMSARVLAGIRAELGGRSHHYDPQRRGPSTGLGYVIIAECIRVLNGKGSISSGPEGTTVRVVLPVARPSGPDKRQGADPFHRP